MKWWWRGKSGEEINDDVALSSSPSSSLTPTLPHPHVQGPASSLSNQQLLLGLDSKAMGEFVGNSAKASELSAPGADPGSEPRSEGPGDS